MLFLSLRHYVKGLGMGSLKGFGVMDAMKAAVEDKKSPAAREGALMAFELLCTRLGRLFEPYVVRRWCGLVGPIKVDDTPPP